jgi:lactate dehydrogenase-like 2-hydroxyacid dehydrogenase
MSISGPILVDVLGCCESLIKEAIRSQADPLSSAVSESRILVIGAGSIGTALSKLLLAFDRPLSTFWITRIRKKYVIHRFFESDHSFALLKIFV